MIQIFHKYKITFSSQGLNIVILSLKISSTYFDMTLDEILHI